MLKLSRTCTAAVTPPPDKRWGRCQTGRQLSADSGTFLTLRMSLTALVLAACGPPLAIVAEISSLYILQVYLHVCHFTPWQQVTLKCVYAVPSKQCRCDRAGTGSTHTTVAE